MTPWNDEREAGAAIRIDAAARRALITWPPGVPVFNPWMATFERLLADPEFRPDYGVVSDWRAATGGDDQAFVEAFAVFCQSLRRARNLTGRWATVVAAGAGTGIPTRPDPAYQVFTQLDDALAWAGGG